MKQALATGQKLVFGGEICNLGAKKQREEKGKPPFLFKIDKKGGYLMLK